MRMPLCLVSECGREVRVWLIWGFRVTAEALANRKAWRLSHDFPTFSNYVSSFSGTPGNKELESGSKLDYKVSLFHTHDTF